MRVLTSGRVLFALLFVVLFAILTVNALGYNQRARTFPLLVAIPVLLGTVANLILEIRGARGGKKPVAAESEVKTASEKIAELEQGKEKFSGAEKRNRELIGIAWLIGYVVAIVLIGFPLATIGYMIVFIRFYNHESWKLTIIYATLLYAFIWVAFVFFLKSTLYPGMLFDWLGM